MTTIAKTCVIFAVTCGSTSMIKAATQETDSFQEVSFETKDAGRIHGNLYGDGKHGVVLAHGAIFNKESWDDLSRRLAQEGHRVLAIDLRGYGKSKGGSRSRAFHLDVLAAVEYLRKAGVNRVSVIGGSMGGGAAAEAAVQSKPGDIDRLILLAGVPIQSPEQIKGNKLFIVSEGDGLHQRIKQQFDKAPEPKKLVVLKGNAHAQHIFKTKQSDALTELIVDWLGEE